MYRTLYVIGLGYLAICGAVALRRVRVHPAQSQPATAFAAGSSGQAWFAAMKPYCNSVEVVVAHRNRPAPKGGEGQGYSAACYGLGGRIDSARAVIDRLPHSQRAEAVAIVFAVAHPVADAGDDASAGPIMELVVDYWPNHYMALYHAGMSEYALGKPTLARKNLTAFLSYYHENDGWTRNARETLARLGAK